MEKPYVIGIDIGGTNTVFGVVDARGTILYSGSIKTGHYDDINDYVKALGDGLQNVINSAGGKDKIKGIGVGAPNGNYFNGCIQLAVERKNSFGTDDQRSDGRHSGHFDKRRQCGGYR